MAITFFADGESIRRLNKVLRYLQQEANDTPRLGDRLFAVTDAAVIVNARISDLILKQQYLSGQVT